MTISFVGSGRASSIAASYPVPIPPCLPGDLVIVAWGITNAADSGMPAPTGYTQVSDLYANDTHDINMGVAYKVMGSVVDTEVSVNGSTSANRGSSGITYVLRGVDLALPLDIASVDATGINSPIPSPGPILPTTPNTVIVIIGAVSGAAALTDDVGTAPTGYGDLFAVASPGAVDSIVIAIALKHWSGGVEVPGQFLGYDIDGGLPASCSWAAVTLAVRAANDDYARGDYIDYDAFEELLKSKQGGKLKPKRVKKLVDALAKDDKLNVSVATQTEVVEILTILDSANIAISDYTAELLELKRLFDEYYEWLAIRLLLLDD